MSLTSMLLSLERCSQSTWASPCPDVGVTNDPLFSRYRYEHDSGDYNESRRGALMYIKFHMAAPPFDDPHAFDGDNAPKEMLIVRSDQAEERPFVHVDGEEVDFNLEMTAKFGTCLHEVLVSGNNSS